MNRTLARLRDTLLGINDSAHRIALGMGLGLLLGVLPGTGAIAAVACAFVIHVNKAAALAGALMVNTWINVVTFPLAIAIGAFLFRIEPAAIAREWSAATRPFFWKSFFGFLLHDAVLAIVTGYAIIGLALAGIGYAVTYAIVKKARKKNST
jgi:uncharacterized protein (DUF2062 family)